jgi:tetratricopeptide (TPR) repeat protein
MSRHNRRGDTGLTRSHRWAIWRPRLGRFKSLLPILLAIQFLATGCPPPVVRVPVPPEDVIKANQVAGEADIAFAKKDYYAALIKYLESGRLNPNSEFIFNKIGISYSQLKYYSDAVFAFNRAIALGPKYPFAYNNLGTVYFARDDKRNAEKYFKKAIGVNPNIASFHINLGTLYVEKRQLEKGLAEWRKGLAIDPSVLRRSEAINLAAASGNPNSPEKMYIMARILASIGDIEHSIESLKKALENGFTNIGAIRTEKDFDPIRQDERFKKFMEGAALLERR